MAAQENLTPLKTLVFSMGVVLMLGSALMVGLVWKKIAAEAHNRAACAGGHVDLKGRGQVVDTVIDGTLMRVTLQKREGANETVTIDLCSGAVLGALTLDTDSPAAATVY